MPTYKSDPSGEVVLEVSSTQGNHHYTARLKNGNVRFTGYGSSDTDKGAVIASLLDLQSRVIKCYSQNPCLKPAFENVVKEIAKAAGMKIDLILAQKEAVLVRPLQDLKSEIDKCKSQNPGLKPAFENAVKEIAQTAEVEINLKDN